jgi:hypothetical protein
MMEKRFIKKERFTVNKAPRIESRSGFSKYQSHSWSKRLPGRVGENPLRSARLFGFSHTMPNWPT